MNQDVLLSRQAYEQYPSLVKDAISMIESDFGYLYGIDELSDQLEVTKYHLIRLFTFNTGISPGQYLIRVRMHHAKLLLQSGGDTPLEIIAGACGYSCANYFCKAFKKQIGMTPSEYIQTAQDNSLFSESENIEKFYL